MAGYNRSYKKSDGNRELLDSNIEIPSALDATTIPIQVDLASNYTKIDGKFSPALFIIISGGIKREKQYFQKIGDIRVFPRIRVEFRAKDSESGEEGLSPLKMYNEA